MFRLGLWELRWGSHEFYFYVYVHVKTCVHQCRHAWRLKRAFNALYLNLYTVVSHTVYQFRAVVSRAEVGLTICKSRRTSMALQAFYATQSHSHVKFPNLGTLRWMRMIVTFSWPAFMSLYSASLKVFSPDHVLIKILQRWVLVHSLTRRNEEVISDRDSLLNWFHMHLCLKCCYGDNFKATQRISIYSSLGLFN